jgi:hypothetical protein
MQNLAPSYKNDIRFSRFIAILFNKLTCIKISYSNLLLEPLSLPGNVRKLWKSDDEMDQLSSKRGLM